MRPSAGGARRRVTFFARAKKGNQRKHAPLSPTSPCVSQLRGRLANSPFGLRQTRRPSAPPRNCAPHGVDRGEVNVKTKKPNPVYRRNAPIHSQNKRHSRSREFNALVDLPTPSEPPSLSETTGGFRRVLSEPEGRVTQPPNRFAQTREAEGRRSGACFLWLLSLHEQRKYARCRAAPAYGSTCTKCFTLFGEQPLRWFAARNHPTRLSR